MSRESDYLDLDFTEAFPSGRTAQSVSRFLPPASMPESDLDLDFTKSTPGGGTGRAVSPCLAAAPMPDSARSTSEHAERMAKVLRKTGVFLTLPRNTRDYGCAMPGDVGLVAVRSGETGDLVSRLVGSSGFAPRRVTNPSDIAKALTTPPAPRLIILDIELPEASGLCVLAAIRRSPETASIPVIMFASHIDAADLASGIMLGADAFLAKPISLRALSMVLHTIAPL